MRNGIVLAQKLYGKFGTIPLDTGESCDGILGIQFSELRLIVRKGYFFFMIFDLHGFTPG
jgi:hypothetical protein